jgi:hypothetical protein
MGAATEEEYLKNVFVICATTEKMSISKTLYVVSVAT